MKYTEEDLKERKLALRLALKQLDAFHREFKKYMQEKDQGDKEYMSLVLSFLKDRNNKK